MGQNGWTMTSDGLRYWRSIRRLTQADVALALGLSLRQYARLEAGISPISRVVQMALRSIELDHPPTSRSSS